jgi:hypothetical protein
MKKIMAISMLCLSLIGASCRHVSSEHELPVFPAAAAACLKESDFSAFLGTSNIVFRTVSGIFTGAPGYVGGATLRSEHRSVNLVVFESHDTALAAVEFRRTAVAAVITPGAHERNGITTWWFSESQALLSIVHGNAILEVHDLRKRYSEIEDALWSAASELMKTAEQSLAPIQQ